MNKQIIEGRWSGLKGKMKEQWGKLTSDRLNVTNGKQDQPSGKTQKDQGTSKENPKK